MIIIIITSFSEYFVDKVHSGSVIKHSQQQKSDHQQSIVRLSSIKCKNYLY